MGRNIRDRRDPNNIVVHITARTTEGLPFVPRVAINMAIQGIIANAQNIYPVNICTFLFMGNHHHFILAGQGNRISSFMEYIQGELSKTFKRFIPGKYKESFWKGRFREQLLGSPEAVIRRTIYIYSNPLDAKLVHSLSDYPGLNSFKAFMSSGATYSELVPRLPVRLCKTLLPNYSKKDDIESAKRHIKYSEGYYELTVTPFAWVKCFKQPLDIAVIKNQILTAIADKEALVSTSRVIGKEKLIAQSLWKSFKSKKNSPTPYVDCPDSKHRKELIKSYQQFRELCRKCWIKIKQGIDTPWPQGSFVPPRLYRPLLLIE